MSYSYPRNTTVTAGQSQSPLVQLDGPLAAVLLPSNFVTSDITFKGSVDGTNEFAMYGTDGTQLKITAAAASNAYALDLVATSWPRFVRLVFGTAQATTDKIISMIVKDV